MRLTDIDIIVQIERLAEACPWDKTQLWVTRTPEGEFGFTCYLENNDKYGFKSVFSSGKTPAEAVDDCIKQAGDRNPEASRLRAIRELQEKIDKLNAVIIGFPPYRPNRELTNGSPSIEVPDSVVDV